MENGKMTLTSLLMPKEMLEELRVIAKADRRSVAFLIRDSIDFWLAARRKPAGNS